MRSKNMTLVILMAAALALSAGCSAVDGVMAPSDPPGGGSPIVEIEQPTNGDTLGDSGADNAGTMSQR